MIQTIKNVCYFDIYLLVLKITFIQILIVIITINKLKMHQMNVETTFLNRD
jgi:hypothetical protein